MAYARNPQWKNYPDTSTPITAEKLENIESGIQNAAADAASAVTSASSAASQAAAAQTRANDAATSADLAVAAAKAPTDTAVATAVNDSTSQTRGALNTYVTSGASPAARKANLAVNVKEYGAKGDGTTDDTTAITNAIAAVPTAGGELYFPAGTYPCANIIIARSNFTIRMHEGAILKKNANGPVITWGGGGYTKLECIGLRIDGQGATFTGGGLVINGGTWPRLNGGEIRDTKDAPLQFTGDGFGHSARVSDMILYPYDGLKGGTGQLVAAISLPADTTQAPNRHFTNIHTNGTLLFTDAGSQDTKFVLCTARNIAYTGTPGKQFLSTVRLASVGDPVTLRGTQSMWSGCAFAGDLTIDANSSSSVIEGCVVAGALTVAAGALKTNVGLNTLQGPFTDRGTQTVVGASPTGQPLAPRTMDPRLMQAANALNANQAVYLRASGRGYITKLALHVGAASGNVCVGVYANDGAGTLARPGAQKATSGSVVCPAAGYAEIALTAGVYVDEGDWLAIVADNAVATFYRAGAVGFSSTLASGLSHHQSTAFPLPATATPSVGAVFSVVMVGIA